MPSDPQGVEAADTGRDAAHYLSELVSEMLAEMDAYSRMLRAMARRSVEHRREARVQTRNVDWLTKKSAESLGELRAALRSLALAAGLEAGVPPGEVEAEIRRLREALDLALEGIVPACAPHNCESVRAANWYGAENKWLRTEVARLRAGRDRLRDDTENNGERVALLADLLDRYGTYWEVTDRGLSPWPNDPDGGELRIVVALQRVLPFLGTAALDVVEANLCDAPPFPARSGEAPAAVAEDEHERLCRELSENPRVEKWTWDSRRGFRVTYRPPAAVAAPADDMPLVFWSPTAGLLWQWDGTFLVPDYEDDTIKEWGFAQPEDAVELRAVAAPAPPHQAQRGDEVAAWLKKHRDGYSKPQVGWFVLDELLEDYRLHADTGTPLGEHACDSPWCCAGEPLAQVGREAGPPAEPTPGVLLSRYSIAMHLLGRLAEHWDDVSASLRNVGDDWEAVGTRLGLAGRALKNDVRDFLNHAPAPSPREEAARAPDDEFRVSYITVGAATERHTERWDGTRWVRCDDHPCDSCGRPLASHPWLGESRPGSHGYWPARGLLGQEPDDARG